VGLAVCAPSPTPYFDHFFRRLVAELPVAPVLVGYTHSRSVWIPPTSAAAKYEEQVFGGPVASDWDRSWWAQWREWRLGGHLIARMRRDRPGIVLLLGYRDPCRWRVMRWCRRQGVLALTWSDVNARGTEAPAAGLRGWAKRRYVQWIDRQLVGGWLVCGTGGREYLRAYGVDERRAFLVPYEPDYAAIDAVGAADVSAVQAAINLEPGRRRLVCSGRLVPTKRFDAVIAAFAAVADERPEWDLVVLGDGPLAGTLRAAVPPGLAERVRFIGFIPAMAKVWAIYKSCDVLVHLADHEPWGLIINEAAACGLALVCTDAVGAGIELVRDGVDGRVVPRGSQEAAVTALREVTEPTTLRRMRAQSRPILEEWRRKADPIDGLRQALRSSGVCLPIPAAPPSLEPEGRPKDAPDDEHLVP